MQIQTNTYLYFQYVPILTPKYIPIQAQILTNTSTDTDQFTQFCESTSQNRQRYCQIRRPRQHRPCQCRSHRQHLSLPVPHRQHPSLSVSQTLLRLPSRRLQRPQNQPHPLGRRQTVPPVFVTAKLSTPPPRNPRAE